MTLTEYRNTYGNRGYGDVRALIANDAAFRKETESLLMLHFGKKPNRNCSDCWFEAYIELTRTPMEKINERSAEFDLRAGAILFDVVAGDRSKMCTRRNLTTELALYHLRTNPDCIRLFSKYPADWQQRAIAESNRRELEQQKKAAEAAREGEKPAVAAQTTKKKTTAQKRRK